MTDPRTAGAPARAPLIRPAVAADLTSIRAIYNAAVLRTTATFDTEPRTASEQERWFAAHGPSHPVLVAEEGGQVVGWASLSPWSERGGYAQTAEVSVYVAEHARGRRIGRALLRALVDLGPALGHHTLIARVAQDNAAALRLHESLGFRPVGVMRQVGLKFGRRLDVHLMQLVYSDPA